MCVGVSVWLGWSGIRVAGWSLQHGYVILVYLYEYTVHVISHGNRFALLHEYFPKYVCSAQCGCFFFLFLDVISRYVFRYVLNGFVIIIIIILLRNFYHTRVNFVYLWLLVVTLKAHASLILLIIGSRRICHTGFVRCKPVYINYLTIKCYIFSYNVLLIITITTRDFLQALFCLCQ